MYGWCLLAAIIAGSHWLRIQVRLGGGVGQNHSKARQMKRESFADDLVGSIMDASTMQSGLPNTVEEQIFGISSSSYTFLGHLAQFWFIMV